ncbi:MAG: ferredoxin--nitrite reductase [Dehalococcoidia bacterium]|nr:ferredoxin--nitrite reductase [Dehalococcoidia bacterium]
MTKGWCAMNKVEAMKTAKDGLDVWPDLVRYAAERTPVTDIPEDDLQRMKWYGVFHRSQRPGTFMMRLRITGGRLTTAQTLAIADVASEFGHGSADITSRQNIQLRDLSLYDIPTVIERLGAAGVQTLQTGLDNVRNYIGCPLAGIDGGELLDTTPLLEAIGEAHLLVREFSNLPRKLNISLAGCREDCGHAQTQDLGFVPATLDVGGREVAGFNVLVGGALGGTSPRLATPLDVFVAPSEVVDVFTALLRVYRDHGPREKRSQARLKWLLDEWGESRLRDAVEAEVGRPLAHAGRDERTHVAGDHLGVHPQRQPGLSYVGLHVPVGRISAAQLAELAHLAERHGGSEVRLTVDQNVVIPHVADDALDGLLAEPLLDALRPDPGVLWRNLVVCTGNDYCHYSLIDTKNRALDVVAELESRGVDAPPGTRIHMSGCVHACGKHHIADIGLQGANVRIDGRVEEAVDVFAGGRLGAQGQLAERVADKVPMACMADTLETLLHERALTMAVRA